MREATGREMDQFTVISSVEDYDNEDVMHTYGIWTRGGKYNLAVVKAPNRYEAVALYLDTNSRIGKPCMTYTGKRARKC